MEKFIPYEKLSKKTQQELNVKECGSWYGITLATHKPEIHNRQRAQQWIDDSTTAPFPSRLTLLYISY